MLSDFNSEKLEKIFQIKVGDVELFRTALTHVSYTRENNLSYFKNCERLEFLGDSLLKLCMSEFLYKKYPDLKEGDLTKIRAVLVSDKNLSQMALKLGLDKLIILGKSEEKTGGRKKTSILACVFEAVLGAYYLDLKFNEIVKFLENIFLVEAEMVSKNIAKYDAKCILQEYTQSLTKTTPTYKIIKESGLQHDKKFEAEVIYEGKVLASATGSTKKEAEQKSAYKACVSLGVIK